MVEIFGYGTSNVENFELWNFKSWKIFILKRQVNENLGFETLNDENVGYG